MRFENSGPSDMVITVMQTPPHGVSLWARPGRPPANEEASYFIPPGGWFDDFGSACAVMPHADDRTEPSRWYWMRSAVPSAAAGL